MVQVFGKFNSLMSENRRERVNTKPGRMSNVGTKRVRRTFRYTQLCGGRPFRRILGGAFAGFLQFK